MSPMSITIATGPFYPTPPAPTGAVQRVWTDLALEFARRGHTVSILACRYPGQSSREQRDGVLIRRRTGLRQGKNIYVDILKDGVYSGVVLGMLPRADILVTNAFWLPAMAPLLRPSAGKVVVCINRVPKGQMFLYKRAARLHAVSTAIADAVAKESPGLAHKLKVITNPVDVAVFTPPTHPRFQGTDRLIVFTGRIHPEKGLHVLVDAAAILRRTRPGVRLRLIGASRIDQGGGGPEYVERLVKQAAASGVPMEVSEPIFDRAKLAAALQAGDVYCYPTLAEQGEASPVAPVEAMATGLAPVVSDIPQFRDNITHGKSGVVFDHRGENVAQNLASALAMLVDDPKLAGTMGAQAAAHAQRVGYGPIAEAFLADFADLLGRPASGGKASGT